MWLGTNVAGNESGRTRYGLCIQWNQVDWPQRPGVVVVRDER